VLEQRNAGDPDRPSSHRSAGIPASVARERVTAEVLEQVIQALTGPPRG
jgi:hypothetical protein